MFLESGVIPKWSKVFPKWSKVTLIYQQVAPNWPQARIAVQSLGLTAAPLTPSNKLAKPTLFNISVFGHHQARAYSHHICHIRLFDVEIAQIRFRNHLHMPNVTPKRPQSDPKATPKRHERFVKSLKSTGKISRFRKRTFVYPELFQNDPKCPLSDRTVSYTHLTLPTKRIV